MSVNIALSDSFTPDSFKCCQRQRHKLYMIQAKYDNGLTQTLARSSINASCDIHSFVMPVDTHKQMNQTPEDKQAQRHSYCKKKQSKT